MNIEDTLVAQRNPNANHIKSNHNVPSHVNLSIAMINADTVSGKTQYPST